MIRGTSPLKIYDGRMDFSQDQLAAIAAIDQWRATSKQSFTLGGLAGTGKSTILAHIADTWTNSAVVSLTGKAANVLRNKGVRRAQTLHSLMYLPFENETTGKISFARRPKLVTESGGHCYSVAVDEASMLDHLLMTDLESYGLPVLYVGDHGQLEPVGKDPGIMANPDFKLERIHRQEAENPIIRLAMAFREGRAVPTWQDPKGRVRIAAKHEITNYMDGTWQILCGFNRTRHRINADIRSRLGRKELPEAGERLICLRNNKDLRIFNGQQCIVTRGGSKIHGRSLSLEIRTDDGRQFVCPCLAEQFGNDLIDFRDQRLAQMDFGYAITCHKAQGDEWQKVVVYEEIIAAWSAQRWRYTAASRAAEQLVYLR